jgi:hypothetical protein
MLNGDPARESAGEISHELFERRRSTELIRSEDFE